MKATARKMKDGSWVADIEDWDQNSANFGGTEHYSIVSPSDKEWLEKNNMDGKEVEGSMRHSESGLEAIGEHGFYLNLPIHSDPANGGKYADLQMQMEHRGPYSGHAGESKNQGLMNYLKANPDNFSSVIPPTPQTGRTYTEGENQWCDNDMKNALSEHYPGTDIDDYFKTWIVNYKK